MTRSLPPCLVLLLAACASAPQPKPTPPPPPSPKPSAPLLTGCLAKTKPEVMMGRFAIGIGQKVSILEQALHIRFVSVLEDSRCALGAQCIWEGNAALQVQLQKDGLEPTDYILNSAARYPATLHYQGYSLTLNQLEPYPQAKVPQDKSSYCAWLTLDKDGWQPQDAAVGQ
ncbi:hypothetical protein PVT67_07185 [Gallaecimonas kandeliae]|uniref:hypothetical protein n=1 Tax=Gallaecimonas kandeliae TaxID=3029055 RepID=UPI002649F422|nr:hypothetical protein [Gallaecimonas kandeliae]WKE67014.1 hypothetical protein PVT67_07185 [Gallaecimonas kandeliae]